MLSLSLCLGSNGETKKSDEDGRIELELETEELDPSLAGGRLMSDQARATIGDGVWQPPILPLLAHDYLPKP